MKKITILAAMLLTANLFAQQAPTGPAIQNSGPGVNTNVKASHAWYRGGNFSGGVAGAKNIFGTMWNSPIYTYTNGQPRMRVNGTLMPNILSATPNTSGYVGIGNFSPTSPLSNPNLGPFSLLHLEGNNNSIPVVGAWRSWMQTGVYFRDFTDAMYVGLKLESANRADAVVSWSDDPSFPGGPDKLRFIFTKAAGSAINLSTDPRNGSGQDGYEYMRMVASTNQTNGINYPTGFIGVGPVFTDLAPPQSRFHINSEDGLSTWLQITNQNNTGQTAKDGLRLGILPSRVAYLRQQENRPFIIQTDWNITPGGIFNGERIRISSINSIGIPNPAGLPNNTTRVSINLLGNAPITAPRSLLHLGANAPAGGGGWRDWMNVGTFYAQSTDNMYVGLRKNEADSNAIDRYDAIINWGDNNANNSSNGPDVLRFIFTAPLNAAIAPPPTNSYNGLEVARFDPDKASTLPAPNFGMMGIGNFSPGSPNILGGIPVDAKLDIDGDLRIRQVTQVDNLEQVLVIDSSDHNRVHWRDINSFGSNFGNLCGNTTLPLTGDYEVDMNSNNLYVHNIGNVNIGDVFCGGPDIARLFVRNTFGGTRPPVGIWSEAAGVANQTAGFFNGSKYGVHTNVGPGGFTGTRAALYAVGGVSGDGPLLSTWAGYFNGDVFTTSTYLPSESNLKDNITPIKGALNTLRSIDAVTFNFKNSSFPSMNLPVGLEYGVIAENIDTVLPDLVKNMIQPEKLDSLGNVIYSSFQFKGVNYTELIPVLIAGIKELDSLNLFKDDMIKSLDDRLTLLENCVNNAGICKLGSQKIENANDEDEGNVIELSNSTAIILDQNLPNPFAEKTTINYLIPDEVMEAQLLFYDINGRIIKTVNINDRGNGKITVYGENLQTGIYTYSLIADSKLIATKKMVKTN